MTRDVLAALAQASGLLALVITVLLLGRAPVRRWFGASFAYLAWAAVPLTLACALVPAQLASRPALALAAPVKRLAADSVAALAPTAPALEDWLVLAWVLGCIAMLLLAWRAHARSLLDLAGPAVSGLWRPAIILPRDFEQRYTPQERGLILAHEQIHLARRDPWCNALCCLIECVFWFHPLVHIGARRFRLDQELSCDAAVMRQNPGSRRSYANAMLKTQLISQASSINCHWHTIHPLKERIMQLKQESASPWRRFAGKLVVGLLLGACGYAAIAAQAGSYRVDLALTRQGQKFTPRLGVNAGEKFAVASGAWRGEFILTKTAGTSMYLQSVLTQNDKVVAKPNLLVALGQPATIAVTGTTEAENFELQVTVAEAD